MPQEGKIGAIFLHTTKLLHLSTIETNFPYTNYPDHNFTAWNYLYPDFMVE